MRALAVAALLALAPVAHADTAGGEKASAEAEQLAKAGAFTEAAGRFREAYRLDPLPKYLCNVGVAYQKAKQLAKAHLYLTECLRTGVNLDVAFLAKVGEVVAAVETTLRDSGFVAVEIAVAPDTATLELETFDRDEKFVGSRTLWMTLGRHTATVSAEGYATQRVEIDATTSTGRIEIALVPGGAAMPAPTPTPITMPAPTPGDGSRPSHRVLPLVVASSALVLAGGAIGFELAGRSKYDESKTLEDNAAQEAAYDAANTRHYVAQALAAGAIVGAGVAVYLFLRPRSESGVTVSPAASASSAGLVLSGRF